MLAKNIFVGMVCVTRVSGKLTWVRVVAKLPRQGRCYQVSGFDSGEMLPALRSATALHACPHGYRCGIGESQLREAQLACEQCSQAIRDLVVREGN